MVLISSWPWKSDFDEKKLKNVNVKTFECSCDLVFEDIDQVVFAFCYEKTQKECGSLTFLYKAWLFIGCIISVMDWKKETSAKDKLIIAIWKIISETSWGSTFFVCFFSTQCKHNLVNIFKNKIAGAFKSFDIFIFQLIPSKSLFRGQDEIKTTFYAYYLKAKLLLHNRTGFHIEIPNRIDTVNNKKC